MIVLNRIFTPIPEVKDVVQISTDNKKTWNDFFYSNVEDEETNRPAGYYYMNKDFFVADGTTWIRVNNGKKVSSLKIYNSVSNRYDVWKSYGYAEWQLIAYEEADYTYYPLIDMNVLEEYQEYGDYKLHLTLV